MIGLLFGAWRWIGDILRAIPWQAYAIIAAIVVLWIAYGKASDWIDSERAAAYAEGVKATDLKWERAEAEAERRQASRNARTNALRADISNEVDQNHAKGRNAILARSDDIRMRREAARRGRGGAQGSGLPSTAEAARLADAEGYDGLSWPVAHKALTTAQLQQQQLNDLIDWVEKQGAVTP